MNTKQPNFEKIKTEFYNFAVKGSKSDFLILMEQVQSVNLLPHFVERKNNFKKELNNWLDNVDIRCSGQLINAVVELGGKLPAWMKDKKFIIDYNEFGFMDIHQCSFVTQRY